MVHPVYAERLKKDIKCLVSTSEEIENIKHKGLRGSYREIGLGKLLSNYLPFGWEVGSGEILDHSGNTSSEIDLLIYNQASIPPILFNINEGCYPVESCAYAFEVKTTSNAQEIKGTLEKFKRLRSLKPLSSTRPVTVYFAFNSDLKDKTEFQRYIEYDDSFSSDPLIDVLCVMGQGYWFSVRDRSSITWYLFEPQEGDFEVGFFLSGIINTINKKNSSAPFGKYTIDENENRRIVYHRDFIKKIEVGISESVFLEAGLKKHQRGDYSGAIESFSLALQDSRQLSSFLFKVSSENFDVGKYDAVLEYTNKVIDTYIPFKYNYRLFEQRGRAYLELARESGEEVSKSHDGRALIEKSLIDFEHAIRLNPAKPELYYCFAFAKMHLGTVGNVENVQEMERVLIKALKLRPQYQDALVLLGMAYSHIGLDSQAKDVYISALAIDPSKEEILRLIVSVEQNLSLKGEKDTIITKGEFPYWIEGNYEPT
ncbi:MAG: DUF6602 domain-containing protein [Almyronema sp.]